MEYSSLQTCLATTVTHMPHGIMQCFLPPSRGNIPAFTANQLKLVLDYATLEECKAELTYYYTRLMASFPGQPG